MADDESREHDDTGAAVEDEDGESDDQKSFRERVEEIRKERAENREEGTDGQSREERMEEMMGGGGPGGPGGMGGNPFAQMMGGMMGGGGMGGPGEMGGNPPGGPREGDASNEVLTREVRKLRDEVHDIRRTLDRIAEALED